MDQKLDQHIKSWINRPKVGSTGQKLDQQVKSWINSKIRSTFIKCNFSKKTTLSLVDQVLDDHDTDILDMKAQIESMWNSCGSKRERRSMASKEVPGYSFFGDNIGKKQD